VFALHGVAVGRGAAHGNAVRAAAYAAAGSVPSKYR